MKCPRCQQENPANDRFCLGCGARLAPACASCGTELPGGARFCLQCGHAVAAGGAVASPSPDPKAFTPKHLAEYREMGMTYWLEKAEAETRELG
jgi:hypothetical protein